MRTLSIFALAHVAAAGSLRHGTVAQRRDKHVDGDLQLFGQIPEEVPETFPTLGTANLAGGGREQRFFKQVQEEIPDKIPAFSTAASAPTEGLSQHSPESYENMKGYQIAQPTPLPVAFNGVFCKGGACQYRVPPPPLTVVPPVMPPPIPLGGMPGREFCRGLGCISGMGSPDNPSLNTFKTNCVHLFNDIAGGMLGKDTDRTVPQVQQSFLNVCKKRVGPLEVGACPAYASTFVGATAVKVDNPTVGGPIEVCADTFWYIQAFKQAEIDLKLTLGALPRGHSLLNTGVNRLGTGGNGPSSPRGLKWRQYAYAHGAIGAPPATARQLGANGAFVQIGAQKPLIPGQDKDADTPRGLPKYRQNPPCATKSKHMVPQAATKYQILAGSPDGAVPPAEVDGELFTHCSNQFSEIMLGFAQTAYQTQKLTKDWCTWQASVTTWVGRKEEYGHPDWSHRTCSGMQNLVSFALKDQLADNAKGLSAQQVCREIFLAIGSVHRTDDIVLNAWQMSLRNPTNMIPKADDTEMAKLLSLTLTHANEVFNKLRTQKNAYDELANAKKDAAAFEPNGAQLQPFGKVAPDLPNSADIDPTSLLAVSVERVRLSK